MEMMIMWGGYVVSVAIAGAAAVVLRKKVGDANQDQEKRDDLFRKLSVLEKELVGAQASLLRKEQECKSLLQERDEKALALDSLKKDFESDNIVQSTDQKNSHAKQAEELFEKLSLVEKELREAKISLVGNEQELRAVLQDRDKKSSALDSLKKDLESKNIDQSIVEEKSFTEQAEELYRKLSVLEKQLSGSQASLLKREQELKVALRDRNDKASKLKALENDFESKIDDIVQSSIQKLSHAEQSKEDAVQAAEDNYEAAAEAYAQIREQKKIIAGLQKELRG